MKIDLTNNRWTLSGYRPFYWHERRGDNPNSHFQPQWQDIPAVVPGSAQTALRKAKLIPDWNVGTNSLLCEWVEHYQWEFRTRLKAVKLAPGECAILHCDGLDYSGWIGIDGKQVATFKGALLRHRFDLTDKLGDGKPHMLSIAFDCPPTEQGQVGKTSESKFFKPRYSYSWDWCPRFVPIGIWDKLWLEVGPTKPRVTKVLASLADDLRTGRMDVTLDASGPVRLVLRKGKTEIASAEGTSLEAPVEPWFPNGHGKQPLYELEVLVDGESIDRRQVGFKRVRWLQNKDAPPNARPLLCEVNGKPVFLQGVNWTPIRMDYHDIPEAEYRKRIDLYKKMGCNVLRVWGGAYLEREAFYNLCDRAGLMVWQEFPLSSSGPDNYAPEDPQAIADLVTIARDYIHRRAHHACKLLWCGGNELQSLPNEKGEQFPLTESHPALAAMKKVVDEEDPETRYLPTSPSGPVFYATPEKVGKNTGLHHHVHGPWNHFGPIDEAVKYWTNDDSLLRSETGMPGMSSFALIKKYAGGINVLPAKMSNPRWAHTSMWWTPKGRFDKELKGLKGDAALKKLVKLSQEFQATILKLASGSCKKRFPTCSGFIIWMGHDAFPTESNTSVIDFDGNPKPAYYAVAEIFKSKL